MQTPWQQFRRFLRSAIPYRARIAFSIGCLLFIALLNAVSVGSLQPVFDALFASEGAGTGISLADAHQAHAGESIGSPAKIPGRPRCERVPFLGRDPLPGLSGQIGVDIRPAASDAPRVRGDPAGYSKRALCPRPNPSPQLLHAARHRRYHVPFQRRYPDAGRRLHRVVPRCAERAPQHPRLHRPAVHDQVGTRAPLLGRPARGDPADRRSSGRRSAAAAHGPRSGAPR